MRNEKTTIFESAYVVGRNSIHVVILSNGIINNGFLGDFQLFSSLLEIHIFGNTEHAKHVCAYFLENFNTKRKQSLIRKIF